jgi:hypothetical protein
MPRRILAVLAAIAVPIAAIGMKPISADAKYLATNGSIDCGLWVKARKQGAALAFESYLVGLMNGLALGSSIEFWYAGGNSVSQDQIFLWMDNYCERLPLSNVIAGSFDLMNERTGNAFMSRVRSLDTQ